MDSTVLTCLLIFVVGSHGLLHGRLPPAQNQVMRTQSSSPSLPNDVCGKTQRAVSSTIAGGKPAELGEFPWMALIGYRIRGQPRSAESWSCGGTLITNQHVLTAAHCLHPVDLTYPSNSGGTIVMEVSKVRLGELNTNVAVNDGARPVDYDIDSIRVHTGWNRSLGLNDIGIIKLRRAVTFTDNVRPICLPPAEAGAIRVTRQDLLTVAGWGKVTAQSTITTGDNFAMRSVTVLLVVAFALLHCASSDEKSNLRLEREKRLPHDKCGITPMMLTKTIVGGKPCELGEFPWMALLGMTPKNIPTVNPAWLCGGTLITDQHVLTAAHCVSDVILTFEKENITVKVEVTKIRLGELDKNPNVTDGAHPRDYDVESVIKHADYDPTTKANDIAIIKLKEKVNFTDEIRPICLPPTVMNDMTFVDEYPTTAGWGTTSMEEDEDDDESDDKPNRLMKVQVKVVKTQDCEKNLTSEFPELQIDEKVLCAGEEGKDSCQGDSGGPLMYFYQPEQGDDEGKHYIIGVVSYGYGCGFRGYPGVYTRVTSYKGWLMDHLDI